MNDELEVHTGTAVTRADMREKATDSWTDVLEDVGDLAGRIAGTDFVPTSFKGSVPAVAASILYGREIGLAPMTALQSLHSIKGKVGLYAEGMRALVLQAGHEIITTESTGAVCTMKGKRRGSDEWTQVTWTLDDARKAGLLQSNKNWQTYPRQMLQARASTELCRLAFPDVIRGLASVEELEQMGEIVGSTDAVVVTGTTAPVKRATRKRAAAPKPEPAERPAPPLPGDEEEEGAESSKVPSAGEASDVQDGSAPPLPDEEETPKTGGSGKTKKAKNSQPPVDDSQPEPPPLDEPDEDGAYEAEVIEAEEEAEPMITPQQRGLLLARFNALEVTDRDERLFTAHVLIGREVDSFNLLTRREAGHLIDTLSNCQSSEDLQRVVTVTAEHAEKQAGK